MHEFVDGVACKVVLRQLKAKVAVLKDAQEDGADDENEPDKEADEAFKRGTADEQRCDVRHGAQLETVLLETPRRSATSCWVSPLDLRRMAKKSPMDDFMVDTSR